MAEQQFLRIKIGKAEYFLPSGVSVAIEKRESLAADSSRSMASAWRESAAGRWPAYCLDEDLIPSLRQDWVRAVFVQAQPNPIGLIGDEIQLVNVDPDNVAPFTPLGPPATSGGHLFTAAYVRDDQISLILDPQALVSYLAALGS